MPRRAGGFSKMEELPLETRKAIDREYQTHWYKFFSPLVRGLTVLDVGAGTGYGVKILRESKAASVVGFDPLPAGPDVIKGTIDDYAGQLFDVVFCLDVIEHVEDDVGFYDQLVALTRRALVLTTPNWNVSKAVNEFHVREYTPLELDELTVEFTVAERRRSIWVSDAALVITPRSHFEPDETSNNYGLLLEKLL